MQRNRLSLLALLAVAGCAHQPASVPSSAPRSQPAAHIPQARPAHQPAGQRIARLARRMVGTPYRYGGTDPAQGFDCSGLVYYTHSAVGVSVPRVSRDQYRRARKVPLSQARPGDIIFFSDAAKLSHIAIYLGDGRFVHAPSSGKTVSEADLNSDYYQEHLVGVGRLH